jgi:glycosyltransferase involved in cell wall biosynthesis
LSVSRHLPAEDGIANYADQLAAALRPERTVTRLGIPFGGGDEVTELWGWLRPLKLLRRARGFDDVLIQYLPYYYVRGGWASRVAGYLALGIVARALPATWVVHERDDERPEEIGRRGRAMFAVEEGARRWLWARAKRLVFHSSWERERFDERFPASGARDERVVDHGSFFTSPVDATRSEARERLGLEPDATILACLGTLSPHKGVDRVIAAARDSGVPGLELHVVGRAIRPMPEVFAHVEELRRLAAETPGVHLHEDYVSDEEFDLWIRAADAVVVGYRSAASSGVVPRVHLLGTTLITSAAGGIAEQARPSDIRFEDQDGLVRAIRLVAS